jgi:predicted DNA-binding transcriptional regulator YafY
VKYSVDKLARAIAECRMVRFQYGKYNLEKKFQLKRNGEWYVVKPHELIWWDNHYYLVAKYGDEKQFRHFRLDRMRNVKS